MSEPVGPSWRSKTALKQGATLELDMTRDWCNDDGVLIFWTWLHAQMGPRDLLDGPELWRWDIYGHNPIRVFFRDRTDAMLFKLTWL